VVLPLSTDHCRAARGLSLRGDDCPGYGMSHAPPSYGFTPREHSAALERFIDRLALTDLTMMVQDWGGPIGLGFTGRRPELVCRLIIDNTFAWPLEGDRPIRLFSLGDGGAHRAIPDGGLQLRAEVLLRAWVRAQARPGRHRRVPGALEGSPAARGGRRRSAAAHGRLRLPPGGGAGAHSVRGSAGPDCVGNADFALGGATRACFERRFPRHRTVLLSNASHFLQEDAGDQIAEAFRAFRKEAG